MRVLVVEDSIPVRTRLVAHLRESGLEIAGEVGTAYHALELVSSVTADAVDAVILDLMLPDRNGMDILAPLRAALPAARIVVLTNAPLPYRRRCLALGADDFLDKSTDFERVAALLSSPSRSPR